MSEDREPTSRAGVLAAIALLLFAMLPFLYVLSVGPASWLASQGYLDDQEGSALRGIHWPLIVVHQSSTPAQPFLDFYIGLWD